MCRWGAASASLGGGRIAGRRSHRSAAVASLGGDLGGGGLGGDGLGGDGLDDSKNRNGPLRLLRGPPALACRFH
ncbi:MAG: hypothetical protein K0S70_2204 [Microbacterium sp.]|nr:hypothetical protein [Microbacterium sp.]